MKLSKRGDLEKESLEFTFTDWKIIGDGRHQKDTILLMIFTLIDK